MVRDEIRDMVKAELERKVKGTTRLATEGDVNRTVGEEVNKLIRDMVPIDDGWRADYLLPTIEAACAAVFEKKGFEALVERAASAKVTKLIAEMTKAK